MSYVPHTPEEIRSMLEQIGANSIEELFEAVPAELRRRAGLKLPAPLGERGLLEYARAQAAQNRGATANSSFLGAGAYQHQIPALVDALASRSEFATTYTPYQAEISQGTLQWIFEFQTLICQLTGLEVANASLYDGASSLAEAVLMALRITRRPRVLVSAGVHPHYRQVLNTYLAGNHPEIEVVALAGDGRTELASVGEDFAAVVVQQPNFFGCIEELEPLANTAHAAGALAISVTAEPLALALLKPPGASGFDVACGEAQSFGVPLSFGGPYVGFLATQDRHVRQLPGRLIGETADASGNRGFVMTLTTREQHIRREKATSNICTNQGLCALRVTIYLALLGQRGLRQLAETNLALAHYAQLALARAGLEPVFSAPTFNEFAVRVPDLARRFDRLVEAGVLPGVRLDRFDPEHRDQLLVCVTEQNSRAEIDALATELSA
ncbi:MAG: aminomethyl-transferring glycine dehydrogenase subunit GcvPA [Myxococcota bacterium]|nr:aminomethyl-transferring glycine dehydrogenase subunit GcvPA [Myxococcota bacterium]